MSSPALELAEREFQSDHNGGDYERFKLFHEESSEPCSKVKWINADVLNWASLAVDEKPSTAESEGHDSSRYDIVLCAFVIHHLSDQDKRAFLQNILRHRINPGGIVLMADVFRATDSESREEWLSRFFTHISTWTAVTEAQKKDFYAHVGSSDHPASIEDFITHIAPESGWIAELLWTNTTEVERLVVLRQLAPAAATASSPQEEGKGVV
jgi:hypothetical protein